MANKAYGAISPFNETYSDKQNYHAIVIRVPSQSYHKMHAQFISISIEACAEVKSTYLPYYDHLFKTIIYDKTFVPSPPLSRFIL